jgi:tetratricopeptide (TPR) repeat protein
VDRLRPRAAEDGDRQDPALQAASGPGRRLSPRRAARVLLAAGALLLALGLSSPAGARSPLVAELETLATHYHENPSRLDAVKDGLARAVEQDPDAETWIALSRVCFIWGDIRATTVEQKLAAYSEGRDAGRHAIALSQRAALAHLFYGINTGRLGQTKGVTQSLRLLPEVREAVQKTLELDPAMPAAYALAGTVDYEVPALFGGSLERAEERFRKGLDLDPHFTALRIGLARVLRRQGRLVDAQRELRLLLDDPAPTNPAEWTMMNVSEARILLDTLDSEGRARLGLRPRPLPPDPMPTRTDR